MFVIEGAKNFASNIYNLKEQNKAKKFKRLN
jgi:hypothetical protein